MMKLFLAPGIHRYLCSRKSTSWHIQVLLLSTLFPHQLGWSVPASVCTEVPGHHQHHLAQQQSTQSQTRSAISVYVTKLQGLTCMEQSWDLVFLKLPQPKVSASD